MQLPRAVDYAATLDERTKRLVMGAVLLALFLTSLDQTVVVAALPKIVADLGALDLLAWTSAAYLLVSTAILPIAGKLSDLYGRKIILLLGITEFLFGSFLCGLSPTMLALVCFRGLQGLGAGVIMAVALTIPADLYVPADRARLQGLIAAVFALSSIVGPLLGGVLTDTLSWHWIFFINLPFGTLALFFILSFMPRLDSGLSRSIDFAGALLLLLTVVPLLVALSFENHSWMSLLKLGLLAVAAVGLAAFIGVEQRAKEPILPLSLFRIPVFSLLCAISVLMGSVFIIAILFLPVFLVNVQSATATQAGAALIPESLGLMVSSFMTGNIVQRTGRYKAAMLAGLVLMGSGFFLLSWIGPATSALQIWVALAVFGLGAGATFPQLNLALQNAVPFKDVGVATAGRLFFSQLGQTISAAVYGSLLVACLSTALTANLAPIAQHLPADLAIHLTPERLRNGGSAVTGELAALRSRLAPPRFDAAQRRQVTAAVETAIKHAFAEGIARVYRAGLPLAAVALLLGLLVPELPLRRSNSPDPSQPLSE
ncbi:MDR family MFS transporter [Gloeobacter kilaueensis]|uniref:EmrB/QacA family drug resistance transporter n=1 Tax=Gloeobacter kilaueensis (strain ATCC BAA-2537 / CCAP 1431/1 / ULC 316 / JS1) TaxID=1183438 RepID=U5QNV9_GLOK1|nr:MDR family MFS transporter [Gloeobacter kilaueensis]AGY59284.1 EmrB/QacA family drug resistance transporter [Gloeobacter kilaueensis JS1]